MLWLPEELGSRVWLGMAPGLLVRLGGALADVGMKQETCNAVSFRFLALEGLVGLAEGALRLLPLTGLLSQPSAAFAAELPAVLPASG